MRYYSARSDIGILGEGAEYMHKYLVVMWLFVVIIKSSHALNAINLLIIKSSNNNIYHRFLFTPDGNKIITVSKYNPIIISIIDTIDAEFYIEDLYPDFND